MKVIILCGGSGVRLWPLSRSQYPKQFLRLPNMKHSIFQLTMKRALMLSKIDNIYFVTNEGYQHLVVGQIEEMGLAPVMQNLLFEPSSQNTLPAIVFGIKQIQKTENDVVVVFSSDHLIENEKLLTETIQSGIELCEKHIVIFGIRPTSPETGYGYIKTGKSLGKGLLVDSFQEKPTREIAEQYIRDGYLWNSGMFMFHTEVFMQELKTHSPKVYEAFQQDAITDCYDMTPSISIDYGLLEKSKINAVIPLSVGWNDLGNFIAFYEKYRSQHDDLGNISFHNEIVLGGNDNMVYSTDNKAIALIGVSNVVVIDQKDALLICERSQTGRVREVVDILKACGDKRADTHITEYREWGSFTLLEETDTYRMQRLTISPRKGFETQMHYHRNEHWVVISGTAQVEVDGVSRLVYDGESLNVKAGQKHRLFNPGKILLEVMEMQSGSYLGADDFAEYD